MDDQAELLTRRLDRERRIRKESETIIEAKSRELYIKSQELERAIAAERRYSEKILADEHTLRENEEKFRSIYEGSNDAVMLLSEKGFFD